MATKKLQKFKAVVIGETQFGKSFKRTIIVKGNTARQAFSKLKYSNDVVDIISFRKVN